MGTTSSYNPSLNRTLNAWYQSEKRRQMSKGLSEQDAEEAVQEGYLKLLTSVEEITVDEDGTTTKPMLRNSVGQALADKMRKEGKDAHCRERGVKSRSEYERDAERDRLRALGVNEYDVLQYGGNVAQDIYRTSTQYSMSTNKDEDGEVQSIEIEDTHDSSHEDYIVEQEFLARAYNRLNVLYSRYPAKLTMYLDLLELQMQGFGRNEIAAKQGISPNTVKNRLTQIRKDLQPVKKEVLELNYMNMQPATERRASAR